jgi:hypothetical protein
MPERHAIAWHGYLGTPTQELPDPSAGSYNRGQDDRGLTTDARP